MYDVIEGQKRSDLPYILTHTGKRFHHLDPRPEDICIQDIAHALSRICRFTGHIAATHYSVAQHAVMVSYACNPQDALCGLHHDDAEAYISDLSTPLKHAPGLEGYRLIERKIMAAVCDHFGMSRHEPLSVKHADRCVLTSEMADLFSHPAAQLEVATRSSIWKRHSKEVIVPWPQGLAEYHFLNRHLQLTGYHGTVGFCGQGLASLIGSPSVKPSTP
jgi:hypothetical protein